MLDAPLAPDSARRGALKALREGRVTVRSVAYDTGPRAVAVAAFVRGHTGLHQVSYLGDSWRCTCTGQAAAGSCSHLLAVQLCTGWAGAPQEAPRAIEDLPLPVGTDRPATARYAGRCACCGRQYAAGDDIRAVAKSEQSPGATWAGPCCLGLALA